MRFTKISAGSTHTVAITEDGTTWAWGGNDPTLLGSGRALTSSSLPVKVKTPTGVKFTNVSAGWYHTLAIGSDNKIYSWGVNLFGELGTSSSSSATPLPVRISAPAGARFVSVCASGYNRYSLALDSNGNAYAWGRNSEGQLGLGDTTNRSVPTKINAPIAFKSISAGGSHSLAIGTDGYTYAWGYNNYGQLGDGGTTRSLTPRRINFGMQFTNVQAGGQNDRGIVGGVYLEGYSLALDAQGNLYAWGHNGYGQLGTGTKTNRYSPTRISTPVPLTAITAGAYHSLAVGSNGRVYAWGWNSSTNNRYTSVGLIGDGSTVDRLSPTIVSTPAGVQFSGVSAGWLQSKALSSDGKVYSWGPNQYGQLGDGTKTGRTRPIQVANPTIAITKVYFDGRLGSNLRHDAGRDLWLVTAPAHSAGTVNVLVYWTLDGVSQTTARLTYTYLSALTVSFDMGGAPGAAPPSQSIPRNGKAKYPTTNPTWEGHWFDGWFTSNGKAWDFDTPISADMTLTARWEAYRFTMNPDQVLTSGSPTTITPPTAPTGIRFMQVSAGDRHTLAIGSDGNTYAWGANSAGQLGTRTNDGGTANAPERVLAPAGVRFTQVSAGGSHSLAIDSSGHAWAWGWNYYGQVGAASSANQPVPVDLSATGRLPTNIVQVSAGGWHSLAIDSSGHVWVCGLNQDSQLGITANAGNYMPNKTPTDLSATGRLPANISQVSAGSKHSLAIDSSKHVWAWGANDSAQLGLPYGSSGAAPTDLNAASRLIVGISQVSAGKDHTLALDVNGHVWSWGYNRYGQLGHTTNSGIVLNVYTLTDLSAAGRLPANISAIGTGEYHSIALDSSGHAWIWGSNQRGQLGVTANNGSPNDNPTPTDLNATGRLTNTIGYISAGGKHSSVIDSDYKILVWGDNNYGQQADGTISNITNPTPRQPNPQELIVTGVKFDQTELSTPPTWDSTNQVWKLTSPAHTSGKVTTNIHWTLGGTEQTDYPLPYRYQWLLPTAGAIPLHRFTGGGLLLLTGLCSTIYAGHQLARRRKAQHRARI
ncbi:InlB B-repeat-containing protein [Bombiscardovia apis]|uniref:RCC1 domain-containing protein n=1 Tax=Bombiscardovia apis TaxID=2932182 RepID=UPI0029558A5F|nr:InlB B-repeat-containing protein [Bombiscardovia apis]